jgi:hypothetical protein
LRDYNKSKAGEIRYEKLCVLVRDKNNKVIGGVNGEIFWRWFFLENLAIDEIFRH